jgi:N-acetylglucosaminyldiphosphoundecaprenol N-acetyl-beta-D-mannosaminyltransferase
MIIDSKNSLDDYSVYGNSLKELILGKKTLINTINQYSYCIAEQDPDFKKALQESDILLPDGVGVVVAVKWLTGKRIKKIAGADVHKHLLEQLNQKCGSCFYLGASESTLIKIKDRIALEYPNVNVGTFSPAYKPQFSKFENQEMIDIINNYRPNVLFVGMTAPKQEKWSCANKSQLNVEVICSIGAVFDFYAGTVKRPSDFWIRLRLEWLIRLVKEPKRMWKRYLYYGPVFVILILKKKVKSVFN